ncbi:hypothetical protein OGATHE_005118 [Ogataea polymorpha]|uniref:Uncharacterized protein n=1 Tax=Ogataea polymorpha TaxID=460523 RepID=A0A9P8T0N4_9ASCO|nr:hypothetical protein OGATHE_005118 [Ogataea polymorpha]
MICTAQWQLGHRNGGSVRPSRLKSFSKDLSAFAYPLCSKYFLIIWLSEFFISLESLISVPLSSVTEGTWWLLIVFKNRTTRFMFDGKEKASPRNTPFLVINIERLTKFTPHPTTSLLPNLHDVRTLDLHSSKLTSLPSLPLLTVIEEVEDTDLVGFLVEISKPSSESSNWHSFGVIHRDGRDWQSIEVAALSRGSAFKAAEGDLPTLLSSTSVTSSSVSVSSLTNSSLTIALAFAGPLFLKISTNLSI